MCSTWLQVPRWLRTHGNVWRTLGRWQLVPAGTGLLLLAVAGVGRGLGVERQVRLKPGETRSVRSRLGGSYSLTHMGISRFETVDRFTTAATLDVRRGGKGVGFLTSERRQYLNGFGRPIREPVISVGIRHGLIEDLRVVLVESIGAEEAVYLIRINPLMSCTWGGSLLLIVAGLLGLVERGE